MEVFSLKCRILLMMWIGPVFCRTKSLTETCEAWKKNGIISELCPEKTRAVYDGGATFQPALWTANNLMMELNNGHIWACFDLAPAKYGFQKYKMRLSTIKEGALVQNFRLAEFTPPKGQVYPNGCTLFRNVGTGMFMLAVQPLDSYKGIPGFCQCWTYDNSNIKSCKSACAISNTRWLKPDDF